MRPVVVHGGGAAINRAMDEAGLEPHFIQGRRYTDDATRDIVERVLAYETNEALGRRIEEFGGRAAAAQFPHARTCCSASGLQLQDEQRPADRPGSRRPRDAQSIATTIDNLCYAGIVPVIPSMCIDEQGEKLNVNADTAATAVAQAVGGRKAGVPQRRERRAPREGRSRFADQLAHRRPGPRADRQRRHRGGHDSQGRSLPGDARQGRPQDPYHRRPAAAFADAGNLYEPRASERRSSRRR